MSTHFLTSKLRFVFKLEIYAGILQILHVSLCLYALNSLKFGQQQQQQKKNGTQAHNHVSFTILPFL